MRAISRIGLPSIGKHLQNGTKEPFVIENALTEWPALAIESERRWTVENLRKRRSLQNHMVPVEFFGNYMSPDLQMLNVEMGDFLSFLGKDEAGQLAQNNENSSSSSGSNSNSNSNDDMTRGTGTGGEPGINHVYLAQYELKELPELEQDVMGVPPVLLESVGRGLMQKTNVWMGKAGVISPSHTDPFHNLLCQVKGRKRVLLHPFEVGEKYLYPAKGTSQPNTSIVEGSMQIGEVDLERYPLVNEAHAHAIEAVLGEGDALFIPKKWWHHCTSLELSFSVNHWWL